MTPNEPTTEALRDALRSTKISDVPRGDPAYIAGWNDAMDHAARIADSLAASAALRESEARATATPGLREAIEGPIYDYLGHNVDSDRLVAAIEARATATPGLDVLLGSLDEDDVLYDYPVAQSGEPMDPVLFVRWDAIRATATPGLREALSDAVKRAGVYEIADAMVWAILDGTFADSSEDQVRHAVYELVGRAALDAATPEDDVERWRRASESLEVIDGIVDDSHAEGCGCPLCHELDNLREVIDAARAYPFASQPMVKG